MTKVRNFVEITPNLPFSEFNFYELYRETFEHSELGRMKKILPLHEMAESLGLVNKSMVPKRGRKSYFTPEGKVALMFLKMKTQMSFPKLKELSCSRTERDRCLTSSLRCIASSTTTSGAVMPARASRTG